MNNQSLIVGSDSYKFTIGVLEYDQKYSSLVDNHHRSFLTQGSRQKPISFLDNEYMDKLIQITYRLVYLKEVIFSQSQENKDIEFRIYGLIFKNQETILEFILGDRASVSHILALIKSGQEEGLCLLLEMIDMIKSNPLLSNYHAKLWEVLSGHNIFEAIHTLIKNMSLSLEER